MSASQISITIGPNPPGRLDKALARDAPDEAALSRARIARLIAEGAVMRDGRPITDVSARVRPGETYMLALPKPALSHMAPEPISLDLIWEDEHLIVVNKPAGMVVHPAPGSPSGTLVNALLHHFGGALSGVGGQARPGIVHRIDKDTSGLLVVARSDAAHQGLAAQFQRHSVRRRYLALVHGVPDAADPRLRGLRGVSFEPGNILKIATGIARHRHDRQRQAVVFGAGRHALTRARLRERFGRPPALALMECWLETGRTHQIRVHMAHAGHALVGDRLYGRRRKPPRAALSPEAAAAVAGFGRQALHAASLGFTHPVSGEEMDFEAPLPEDMAALLALLRESGAGAAPG